MQLTIHTLDSAPADSRALLEGIQADLGLLPKLAAATAESPTLLRAFDAMRRAVAAGTLDPVHRELAGLTVGVAVDNRYGVAFHSTMLASLA
jgi:alkylhydroperoxidase family enzyme